MAAIRSTLVGGIAILAASAAARAADLDGTEWLTEDGRARVAFAHEETGLVGRIVWLAREAETGETALDTKNPDEALRTRPLVGAPMAWGFEPRQENVWDKGRIYAADDGKTYNAKLVLEGDTLVLTGCIRWPLCRDNTWTRASDPE